MSVVSDLGLTPVLIALAGSVGAIAVGVLNYVQNRRKVGNDADQVFVGTAQDVVNLVRGELKGALIETTRLRAEIAVLRERLDTYEDVTREHVPWDYKVREKLAELNHDPGEPPPLRPPRTPRG